MESEAKSGAEQKPSGLINHPKYHSHSGGVCLCYYLSVCLSAQPWWLRPVCLSVCPACLSVRQRVSQLQPTQGTPLQWQMTQTWVGLGAFGTTGWPNKEYVCGSVERKDTRAAPSRRILVSSVSIFSLLTASSACLFYTDNWCCCSHKANTAITYNFDLNWTLQPEPIHNLTPTVSNSMCVRLLQVVCARQDCKI